MSLLTVAKFLILTVLFIIAGSSVFSSMFRKHRFLGFLVAVITILGSFYLMADIYKDLGETLKGDFKVFRDKLQDGNLGPEMVQLPGGTFQMGDGQGIGYDGERPVHTVTVGEFAIGKHEVTFAEYDRFAEMIGREKPDDGGWGRGSRPVVNVSWEDATAYAQWLSNQTGYIYRLPTEAEWEYAARAGTTTAYSFGSEESQLRQYAWYRDNSDRKTHPVGQKKPNPWGLHDVHGNVWEWTQDWYDSDYYTNSPQDNPQGPDSGNRRVIRGVSWFDPARYCRSAHRGHWDPTEHNVAMGFRLLRVHP